MKLVQGERGHFFTPSGKKQAGCHKVPKHASGARRKLARLVGREGGRERKRKRGRRIKEERKKRKEGRKEGRKE